MLSKTLLISFIKQPTLMPIVFFFKCFLKASIFIILCILKIMKMLFISCCYFFYFFWEIQSSAIFLLPFHKFNIKMSDETAIIMATRFSLHKLANAIFVTTQKRTCIKSSKLPRWWTTKKGTFRDLKETSS